MITEELLNLNGWRSVHHQVDGHDYWAYSEITGFTTEGNRWRAEFVAGRNTLKIWEVDEPDCDCDIYIRVADEPWIFREAFRFLGIDFELKVSNVKNLE